MHPNRRRKKRPNYGLRTVEVTRGKNGFGFTISGQQPCILSCIVNNSPASQAGLRAGDFLISVNDVSVLKMAHEAVVNLIGNCLDPIRMTIAENFYSDSSSDDELLECGKMVNGRKPKYMHKPRPNRKVNTKGIAVEPNEKNVSKFRGEIEVEDETNSLEFKVVVGYIGTIEMPKQLLPNSRFQTVCNCIRKLRQEKRMPTSVLMTILPNCLTLKNATNQIIAIYPTNRIVYVGTTTDKDCKYFGLVTSAVNNPLQSNDDVNISNSCHVFLIDSKISEHTLHMHKSETFKIHCTQDTTNIGHCLEFPNSALYIVNLIQTIFKLKSDPINQNDLPVMANSPQPSASSNSDSGIGYRDDCGNVSDRILVVDFPTYRPLPIINNNGYRPQGIDGGDLPLEAFELLYPNGNMNNDRFEFDQNILNNSKAYENIRNFIALLQKQNNDLLKENDRLTCQTASTDMNLENFDNQSNATTSCLTYNESAVDVPEHYNDDADSHYKLKEYGSVDNIASSKCNSTNNNDSTLVFRVPFDAKKVKKKSIKIVNSCDDLKCQNSNNMTKINLSYEELSNNNLFDGEVYPYGSLQDLNECWENRYRQSTSTTNNGRRDITQSEPDVRIHRNISDKSDNVGHDVDNSNSSGKSGCRDNPSAWASSFEKLLENRTGIHAFADFLKKEFSAENIHFWVACERYRLTSSTIDRLAEAQRIFKQHLSNGAIEAVNVDAAGRQAAKQGLSEAQTNLFSSAQKQIFNLMKFDSYPRFLKSELYKQCLAGEYCVLAFDPRLTLKESQHSSTLSKLKKSLSNAEDRRRKSLLPWNRKHNGNHNSDGSNNTLQKNSTHQGANENKHLAPLAAAAATTTTLTSSDIHSSHSSLTSLDLASNQDTLKADSSSTDSRTSLCRVLLNNGSTTVVQIKDCETIHQLVTRLLEKRGLNYSAFEVLTNKHPKPLDPTESSSNLAGCEVTVEQRVVFKLDMPDKKIVSVKSKYTKIIVDVLRPILHKYKYNFDNILVTKSDGHTLIDVNLPVTAIDNERLNIQIKEEYNNYCEASMKSNNQKITKLEEITNKVFEGILQEKSDQGKFKQPKSDRGSIKSEEWGSDHSSGLLGKFLRRDSGLHDKKKKLGFGRINSNGRCVENCAEDVETTSKKPLIAKLKSGASKLHVGTYSERDELVEGLTRAQRRLEDQRGTEINFELPDFLKNKDDGNSSLRSNQNTSDRCCKINNNLNDDKLEPSITSNLAKQDISANNKNTTQFSSTVVSLPKSNNIDLVEKLENVSTTSKLDRCRKIDPPPLPPKPKIVPIKPQNWGQSSFYKAKDVAPLEKCADMFLEHSSSSFV